MHQGVKTLTPGADRICSLCHQMSFPEAHLQPRAHPQQPGFMDPEAYKIRGALFLTKQYSIRHKVMEGAQTSDPGNYASLALRKLSYAP